jgi:hypothetical protein
MSDFGFEGGGNGPRREWADIDPARPREAQELASLIAEIDVPGLGRVLQGTTVRCRYQIVYFSPAHYLLEYIIIHLPQIKQLGEAAATGKTAYETVNATRSWWRERQKKKTDLEEKRREHPKARIVGPNGERIAYDFSLPPDAPGIWERIRRRWSRRRR